VLDLFFNYLVGGTQTLYDKDTGPSGSQLPESPLEIRERITDLMPALRRVFFNAALVNF